MVTSLPVQQQHGGLLPMDAYTNVVGAAMPLQVRTFLPSCNTLGVQLMPCKVPTEWPAHHRKVRRC